MSDEPKIPPTCQIAHERTPVEMTCVCGKTAWAVFTPLGVVQPTGWILSNRVLQTPEGIRFLFACTSECLPALHESLPMMPPASGG